MDCLVVIDDGVGVSPAELAGLWSADGEASGLGSAQVVPARPGVFLPGLTEWLWIPLAINISSAGLVALVSRLVKLANQAKPGAAVEELEVVEVSSPDGARVVVIRSRRSPS